MPRISRPGISSAGIVGALACLLLFTLVPAAAYGGGEILKGKGTFQFGADLARFYGDSAKNYVEVYYAIRENTLAYKSDSGRFLGGVNMRLEVRRDTAVLAEKEWTVPHSLTDTGKLSSGQQMVGIEAVALPEGDYIATLSGYDVNDAARRDSFAMPLQVRPFPADREALSDVEFCTSIQQSAHTASVFYKNTLEVIPNASKLYGAGLPVVYYYVEAYNLARNSPAAAQTMTVHTAVVDAAGREVISHDRLKPRTHNSSVEMGTTNVSSLRSGTYLFRISLVDSQKTILASTEKKFFVYRPGTLPDSAESADQWRFGSADYASMSDSLLDLECAEAQYIATAPEVLQFGRLSDRRARERFLTEFWKRRDPDPATPANEFKEQYLARVDYANKNLGFGFRPGWKSDRGRTHILYGQPDEIERFPSSSESLPYEIWHYNSIQGGVIFVFVDRTGLGDYTLVHSTHRNELHDENWFREYAQKSQ